MVKSQKFYLKVAIYLVTNLILISCGTPLGRDGDISHLTSLERDSLAKGYDDTSDYFLQPSQIHRIYKDSALQMQPENVDIRQRFSYSFKKVGEHIRAMEILNKAVEIDVAHKKADAMQYRAWSLLYYYRDYTGTIRDVDSISSITGNQYNTCWGEPCGFLKGQALYKLGKFSEAIDTFDAVNQQEAAMGFDINDNHLLYFYKGRCFAEMDRHNEAITSYENALVSVKEFPEAYYQLALSYRAMEDYDSAKKYLLLAQNYLKYGMDEPYVERFDEVFSYQIEEQLSFYDSLVH